MTEEEKKFINLITKVGDTKRMLLKMSTTSPLYQAKLQEVNHLSALKDDVEKIVNE